MNFCFKQHRPLPNLVALLFLATAMSTANATTLTYPSASCNSGLQACIDAASPGDTVEVATSNPIGEDLMIDKSLTVRPAAGFGPVLDDFASVLLLNAEPSANTIVFEGFTLNPGYVEARQTSTKPFDVRIRNLTFTDTYNDRSAIEIGTNFPGPYGPVTFEVSDNDITIPDTVNGIQAISVNGGDASTFQGTIRGNSIVHSAGGQSGAIGVFNNHSDLTVDVVGNRVIGANLNDGITFFQFGDGSANVRIINNLVEGQAGDTGNPAAVAISVGEGDASFFVLNNTLVDSETGISITGRDDLGATWSGVVANNIVANMSKWGITTHDPVASVINEYNLVFNTADDFFTPGPGTLFVDPQFVGGGDYHLTLGSPAQNAGNDARVPGDVTVDLDVLPRIQGTAVDLGAYELVVPEPSAAVMLLAIMLTTAYRRRKGES
jgi:hypothetical protein